MNDSRHALLTQPVWRIIDQSSLGPMFDALQSFGMDDTLCTTVGSGQSVATARAWVHYDTIVLGISDTRVPHLAAGLDALHDAGFRTIVRNSGGLAVVLDDGVLNLSLIFAEKDRSIDIDSGYDAMVDVVRAMFADFPVDIEAFEVVGSYCPGSYDLSIGGRKFAGISQRRIRGGVAVQIYLCMDGSGAERAEVVKAFYDAAIKGEPTKFTYPDVKPEVMASLTELLGTPLTVQDGMLRFLQTLKKLGSELESDSLTPDEQTLYTSYYDRVVERNEKALKTPRSE